MRAVKRKKRKDMRRIKSARLYKVREFAFAIDVSKATVRRWIRHGLPSLGSGPNRLIEGEKAKAWLKQQEAQRKKKCGHKQMYCMKCKLPRSPRYRSVGMQPQGPKRFAVSAKCAVCDTKMYRIFSAAQTPEFIEAIELNKPTISSLNENRKARLNARQSAPAGEKGKMDAFSDSPQIEMDKYFSFDPQEENSNE